MIRTTTAEFLLSRGIHQGLSEYERYELPSNQHAYVCPDGSAMVYDGAFSVWSAIDRFTFNEMIADFS